MCPGAGHPDLQSVVWFRLTIDLFIENLTKLANADSTGTEIGYELPPLASARCGRAHANTTRYVS
jgi:hypothetical protein